MKHSYYSQFDQGTQNWANFPYFTNQVCPMHDCPDLDTQENLIECEKNILVQQEDISYIIMIFLVVT